MGALVHDECHQHVRVNSHRNQSPCFIYHVHSIIAIPRPHENRVIADPHPQQILSRCHLINEQKPELAYYVEQAQTLAAMHKNREVVHVFRRIRNVALFLVLCFAFRRLAYLRDMHFRIHFAFLLLHKAKHLRTGALIMDCHVPKATAMSLQNLRARSLNQIQLNMTQNCLSPVV